MRTLVANLTLCLLLCGCGSAGTTTDAPQGATSWGVRVLNDSKYIIAVCRHRVGSSQASAWLDWHEVIHDGIGIVPGLTVDVVDAERYRFAGGPYDRADIVLIAFDPNGNFADRFRFERADIDLGTGTRVFLNLETDDFVLQP